MTELVRESIDAVRRYVRAKGLSAFDGMPAQVAAAFQALDLAGLPFSPASAQAGTPDLTNDLYVLVPNLCQIDPPTKGDER
jgi:hypothetical protein